MGILNRLSYMWQQFINHGGNPLIFGENSTWSVDQIPDQSGKITPSFPTPILGLIVARVSSTPELGLWVLPAWMLLSTRSVVGKTPGLTVYYDRRSQFQRKTRVADCRSITQASNQG
ncbi:hypothetical protein I350_02173 [Cryptococcus amylolentus CBS 6273]|uniref:Uncharacterized protein n=1 Tax=Cryptococcus amylolentus CBS 6273 TaxID=1296118 RepID=A0A1E3KA08_9TREE|nr:hypothetical protein I350_02173 [Cryptococcus amylolentus CBS 6273]